MSRTRRAGSRGSAARVAASATALTLALGVAACTGDDGSSGDGPSETPAATASGGPAAVATRARFGTIAGTLPKKKRPGVRDGVQKAFDRWVDAAYLGGEYPRTDFSGAFPGFTKGARARAGRDLALMSNKAIGKRVTAVEPVRRTVRIDVLAPKGRASAATARFALRFRTAGDAAGVSRVKGRLLLVPKGGSWKVFGYDVSRSEVR